VSTPLNGTRSDIYLLELNDELIPNSEKVTDIGFSWFATVSLGFTMEGCAKGKIAVAQYNVKVFGASGPSWKLAKSSAREASNRPEASRLVGHHL